MNKFKFRYSWFLYLIALPLIFFGISLVLFLAYNGTITLELKYSVIINNLIIYFVVFIDFLMLLLIVKGAMMALNLGYYYAIDSEGIIVTMFYKQRKLLFSEIKNYFIMDEKQVGDLIYRINNSMLDFSNMTVGKQYQLQKAIIQLNKYSGISLPTASTDTSIGLTNNVSVPVYMKALKVNPRKGNYILVIMNNEDMRILTPEKAEEFFRLLPK